ncbi:MAG: hypothetical protein IJU92_02770 [Spirochaetaceae bacterium]|nr:hypothetical protein [Spirochaetaceae bacterium]
MLLISQYTFDSSYTDIRSGGAFFYINCQVHTYKIIVVKAIYALVIGVSFFILSCLFFVDTTSLIALVWLSPFFIFLTAFTYCTTIITRKSDLLTTAISGTITFAVLELMPLIRFFALRFCVLTFLAVCAIWLSTIFSNTVFYRTEISSYVNNQPIFYSVTGNVLVHHLAVLHFTCVS